MKENWLSCAFIAACLVAGCNSPLQPLQPQQSAVTSQSPATIDPHSIEMVDGKMERSKAFRIDGDLRPIWAVSGRIENHSNLELKRVTFRLSIYPRGSSREVDTATFTVDTDIPSGSIGSFKRDIQILPPSGNWSWSYAVVEAVAK